MPVAATGSRKFYKRFGDDIAGELVDWFNAVDKYQSHLKEMNELNRSDSKPRSKPRVPRYVLRCEESSAPTVWGEIAAMRADL